MTRFDSSGRARMREERLKTGSVWHLRALLCFLRPHKLLAVLALVAVSCTAAAELSVGQAVRLVVDHGFSPENERFLNFYFLAMFGVVAVLAVAWFCQLYLISRLGERVILDVRAEVYGHVVGLSPAFFDGIKTGEVLSRLTTDTTVIRTVIGLSASFALRNLLILVGSTVLLLVTSLKLSAMVLLLMPLAFLPIGHLGWKLRRLSRASQDRVADLSAMAGEVLGAMQTVQAFTHEEIDRKTFRQAAEEACGTGVRRGTWGAGLKALVVLLIFGLVTGVLWIGAKDVLDGTMTSGELTAFVIYSLFVAGSLGALAEVWGELVQAVGAAERLLELLGHSPEIAAPPGAIPLPEPPQGAIRFENVRFFYPTRTETPALDGFDLEVLPGETVALVGPSGAGKSTVFSLLLRFYDPQFGRVTMDGVDLPRVDPRAVRSRISLVPQDPVIFSGDVTENIRYGHPSADEQQVRGAAVAAGAIEFIEALPQGFGTPLGERGVRLSGGQRQRLAIARALLRTSSILLFDEATSALDSESEQLIHRALNRMAGVRTIVIIAHRLATALMADRIVVMEEGRVTATGTHQELLQRGGMYARLVQLQFAIR